MFADDRCIMAAYTIR